MRDVARDRGGGMIVKPLLAAGIAVWAAAAAAMPPVEAYGQLPSVDLIALSPDGKRLALAVTGGGIREVQVRPSPIASLSPCSRPEASRFATSSGSATIT